jgi:hypothetical protein
MATTGTGLPGASATGLNVPLVYDERALKQIQVSLPVPRYSGAPTDWPLFETQFAEYWSLSGLPDNYKVHFLISCLPSGKQAMYKRLVSYMQWSFQQVYDRVSSTANGMVDPNILRNQWEACKLTGKGYDAYADWYCEWCALAAQDGNVSAHDMRLSYLRNTGDRYQRKLLEQEQRLGEMMSAGAMNAFLLPAYERDQRVYSLQKQHPSTQNRGNRHIRSVAEVPPVPTDVPVDSDSEDIRATTDRQSRSRSAGRSDSRQPKRDPSKDSRRTGREASKDGRGGGRSASRGPAQDGYDNAPRKPGTWDSMKKEEQVKWQKDYDSRRCFVCHEEGHNARSCTQGKSAGDRPSRPDTKKG